MRAADEHRWRSGDYFVCRFRGVGNGDIVVGRVEGTRGGIGGHVVVCDLRTNRNGERKLATFSKRHFRVSKPDADLVIQSSDQREAAVELYARLSGRLRLVPVAGHTATDAPLVQEAQRAIGGLTNAGGNMRSRAMLGVVGTEARAEIMDVTPEMAKRWLATNTKNNRPVSQTTVDAYARDMTAGRWELTHQGVAFNRTGELVDGQHRLRAVVSSGATVRMMVATGFAVEYDSPLDQGRLRSAAHVLGRPTRWAATVRALYLMTNDKLNEAMRKVTVCEIQETYAAHRSEVDSVWGHFNDSLPGGVTAALVWALPLDRDRVIEFGVGVRDGEMLRSGHPAYALRRWMEKHKRSATPVMYTLAACNALKYALDGESLASVYVGETGFRWLCQRRRAMRVHATPSHR